MKTPLEALIEQLEKIENHVITTDNVIHAAKELLHTEKEHLINMAKPYYDVVKHLQPTITPERRYNKIYEK